MKKNYLCLCFCALALNTIAQQPPGNLHTSLPVMDNNWYKKAEAYLEKQQRSFRKLDESNFGSINNDNHFGSIINSRGYTIKNSENGKREDWQVQFELNSVNGIAYTGHDAIAAIEDNRLSFENTDLLTEYLNGKDGMRQNFILKHRVGDAHGLTLAIRVSTCLAMSLKNNKLIFHDHDDRTVLEYDQLVVWDADHQPLKASMDLSGDILTIFVEDDHASYPVTIDPLNHAPNWTDSGDGLLFPLLNDLTAHVLYGFSVNAAGDINNDGFSDVVIGAPAYVDIISVSGGTYNLVSVGAAFVYYGSASGLPASPNEVLQPTTEAGALFGYSVSTAGDVNGDGFKDIVVGAPGDHTSLNVGIIPVATSVAVGKVYVYYGGPAGTFDGNVNTEPTASVSLSLTQTDFPALITAPVNPLYGFSVSSAGDVNGDGKADILVGSPAYTRLLPVPLQTGRVDIYYGSAAGISAASKHSITGITLNALFGFSVSTAGNVNKDKNGSVDIDDIIVGAPGDLTFIGAGQAYVFHGNVAGISANTASSANTSLSTGILTTLFGYCVANGGDLNGDGFADVLVGEPAALENVLSQLVSVGAVHVYYGSATGITASGSTTLTSPHRPSLLGFIEGNLLYGFSVHTAGDMNCDGINDIVVGEPGGTALSLGSGVLGLVSTNSLSGRAYIYTGRAGAGPSNSASYTFEENGPVSVANMIGYSVSTAGDINGDGKADVLIGAPNGTLDLSASIIPLVGDLLHIVTTNSVGSSYVFTGCLSIVLPVTLTDFTAQRKANSVAITWRSEKELNFSHYELEYSSNGRDFKQIAIVFGENNNINNYSFEHKNPGELNYYRLKMVDLDGSSKYSETRFIRFSNSLYVVVSVYPNPANEFTKLRVENIARGNYLLKIINTEGQAEMNRQISINSDQYEEQIPISFLKSGQHLVILYNKDGRRVGSAQIVVQR